MCVRKIWRVGFASTDGSGRIVATAMPWPLPNAISGPSGHLSFVRSRGPGSWRHFLLARRLSWICVAVTLSTW